MKRKSPIMILCLPHIRLKADDHWWLPTVIKIVEVLYNARWSGIKHKYIFMEHSVLESVIIQVMMVRILYLYSIII